MGNKPILKIKIDGKALKEQIYNKGYTLNSIAKEIGVSSRTIRHYLDINEMPPYIHEKIYTVVENVRRQYTECLKELARIETRWLKAKPAQDEIHRFHELTICAYELEQIMN